MNKALRTLLLAAVAMPALAAEPAPGVSAGTIVVGQSAAFTGPAAQLGIQMRDGMKAWFDQVNAQGGINGRKIELVTRDDQYESKLAAENTKKLIEEDKVFALIGYVGTPTSAASMPIFTEAKVPFVGPFTGAQLLHEPMNRYIFNVRASYNHETDRIIEQLLTTGSKRFAVFYQNDAYGQAGLNGTKLAVGKRGGDIVAMGTVERNTVDVDKAVKEIVAKNPDAIVMVSAYKSIAAFVRAAKKAGYTGQFYNVSFVGSKALSDELGKDGVGVAISQVVPFPWSQKIGLVKEFTALAAKSKVDVNFSSLEGFIVAKVFTEGLKRTGKDVTREKFVSAMEGMDSVDLGGFSVGYSSSSRTGSSYVDLTIIARDGKFRN